MGNEQRIADARRIYELEQDNKRLRLKIEAGPNRSWLEVDDPDVIACMGSSEACARSGCQLAAVLDPDGRRAQVDRWMVELFRIPADNIPNNDVVSAADVRRWLDARYREMAAAVRL